MHRIGKRGGPKATSEPGNVVYGKGDLNSMPPTGSGIWATLMIGCHFALIVGEIGNFEDRDISFDEIDGESCVTIHIRSSKYDQCRLGVHRTLVATGRSMCPVLGIAQWLDMENWNARAPTSVVSATIATKINRFLKYLATECGMGPDRVGSHSAREGFAATLYANGGGPIEIQRWGRWKSPGYMRYSWHGNVRLRTLIYALTRGTDLSDHILAPERKKKRKMSSKSTYRCGGKSEGEKSERVEEMIETPFGEVMSDFGMEMKKLAKGEGDIVQEEKACLKCAQERKEPKGVKECKSPRDGMCGELGRDYLSEEDDG